MTDNIELTVPASHVRFWTEDASAWAAVEVPWDLLVMTVAEGRPTP